MIDKTLNKYLSDLKFLHEKYNEFPNKDFYCRLVYVGRKIVNLLVDYSNQYDFNFKIDNKIITPIKYGTTFNLVNLAYTDQNDRLYSLDLMRVDEILVSLKDEETKRKIIESERIRAQLIFKKISGKLSKLYSFLRVTESTNNNPYKIIIEDDTYKSVISEDDGNGQKSLNYFTIFHIALYYASNYDNSLLSGKYKSVSKKIHNLFLSENKQETVM